MTEKRLKEIEERNSMGLDTRDLVAAVRAERKRADEWCQAYDRLRASIKSAFQRLINYRLADPAGSASPAEAEPEDGAS